MTEPLVALSIDLDALDLYLGLYGLDEGVLSDKARAAVPARAAERFGELCASLGIRGTAFVVGRDLAAGRGHAELKALHRDGHELASHSFDHDYALTRRSPAEIDADLARAEEAIESLCGERPVGFRAPGYTLSPVLIEVLRARGYRYDSSLLPSPPYYAAKAAVMGALAIRGRTSRSILGHPGQLFRSRQPRAIAEGVVELPVAVLPGLRLPWIGTLVATVPAAVSSAMAAAFRWDRLVVVELHGVDLCDASDGVPPELVARQRDLAVPATLKRARIEAALEGLLQRRRAVTLAEGACLASGGSLA